MIQVEKIVKDREDLETDLRLRILEYHLSIIVRLKPDDMRHTLCTVQGFRCEVRRTYEGDYVIGGKRASALSDAIRIYFELLAPSVTGLHRDK